MPLILLGELVLYPVWGKSKISGPKDLSAKAWVSSDGKALHLRVRVWDERLVLKKDPVNSDHVELWFALPFLKETPVPNFYTSGDTALFWETPEGEGMPPGLKREKVFLGMVHLALYPDSRPAWLLDREFYEPLEKLGFAIADPSNLIEYRAKTLPDGYEIEATIPPEAFLWVPSEKVPELLWLCDVVDVDRDKQESLLSSSKRRRWANPRTFSTLKISPAIEIEEIDPLTADVVSHLSPTAGGWFLSPTDWAPFYVDAEEFFFFKGQWWEAKRVSRVFVEWGYPKILPEGDLTEALYAGKAGFWYKGQFVDDFWTQDLKAQTLTFSDGKPGVFVLAQEGAPINPVARCGGSYTVGAHLYRLTTSGFREIFSALINDCLPYVEFNPPVPEELLEPLYDPDISETFDPDWFSGDWKDMDIGKSTLWLEAYRFVKDKRGRVKAIEIKILAGNKKVRLRFKLSPRGAEFERVKESLR